MLGTGGEIIPEGCYIEALGTTVTYVNNRFTEINRIALGFWFTPLNRPPSVYFSSFLHLIRNGETNGQNQLGLGLNPNGTISVFRGDDFSGFGGETVANGTTPLTNGVAHWIEIDCLFGGGTSGYFRLRLNESPEITLDNFNTSPRGGGVTGVSFTGGADTRKIIGGLYIGDGQEGFLGKCRVERVYRQPEANLYPTPYFFENRLFDSTAVAPPSVPLAEFSAPTYTPDTLYAVQATRLVNPGVNSNAQVVVDWINGPLPQAVEAAEDALYVEVLMSAAGENPTRSSLRQKYSAIPGSSVP